MQNITSLVRAGRVGYATFWDGNKYIQCRRISDRSLRCEAAGTSMQPSLKSVLTGDRLTRLAALGWTLDPSFGNYVQIFPADMPTDRAADHVVRALVEAYAANVNDLDVATSWVADTPCPPRNGPSQNLAGSVNDAPSMRATAVRTCFYTPPATTPQTASSAAELVAIYGTSTTAEIQRLRINATRRVYIVFDAGIGYIQCAPEVPPVAIYCEAQSAESWAALTTVLTPERIARLHNAGYADPGRAPNYSKSYALDKYKDAAIASEILTILHEAYGYTGATKLKTTTE
ncbi:TY-Chap domain-containing protein [Afipia sp. NBIMC_P1-C3]|uniref:TY-Chap domain-containing protein n=1 Tax=Afipia sp. NBIMC_P1-C3 TaxID=1320554 RepID=UPI004037EF8C